MKTATLSLHHLTALDASCFELVDLAALTGCEDVCVFTFMPETIRHRYPVITESEIGPLAVKMRDAGITCCDLEVFPLFEDTDLDELRRGLERGARLGARFATVHSHIADIEKASDRLSELAEYMASLAIRPVIEFNPFSKCATLDAACALADRIETTRIDVALDMLHAVRTKATVGELAACHHRFSYVQLCDGPLQLPAENHWREALQDRLPPGAGEFPLVQMLKPLMEGCSFSVEVPQNRKRKNGETAERRVLEAVKAARHILADAGFDVD